MKKMVGYIVSIVGLGVMTLGLGMFKIESGFLGGINENYVLWVGIILIAIGVVMSLMDKNSGSKSKQLQKEVPIYKGKEIVGYRMSGK